MSVPFDRKYSTEGRNYSSGGGGGGYGGGGGGGGEEELATTLLRKASMLAMGGRITAEEKGFM